MSAHPRSQSSFLLRCLLLALGACCAQLQAASGNWSRTVGDPIADMEYERFRYDLDLRPVRLSDASAGRVDCIECAPASALQLDPNERLGQRLKHTYRKLGEDLAARVWDDPKGRRIRFDVAGRPGLGLVIPLD